MRRSARTLFSIRPNPNLHSALALLLIFSVATIAYWKGLSGPYVFDDHNNIVTNPNLRISDLSISSLWQAAMAGDAGPLKRPLSMVTFAINRVSTGLDPFYFKATNLCIHLFNGLLVFFLARALLGVRPGLLDRKRIDHVALFTTAVWVLHPVHLTSVLYVVQRMTSMCGTFVFLGLICYVHLRSAPLSIRQRILLLWVGVPLFTALAALAKENGVLIIGYAFIIEAVLFDFRREHDWRKGTPIQFFAAFLVLPLFLVASYLLANPDWFARAAETRDFNAVERMLTEARVLWMYVGMMVIPAISNLALFYDDISISRSLLEPVTTLPAVLAWCAVGGTALLLRRRTPWYSFSVLWFLMGHAMESSFILLELVHPHRNYVAYLGPMLGLSAGGSRLMITYTQKLTTVVCGVIIVILAGTTALRAYQWRNPLDLAVYEVSHRPSSARANYEIARLLHLAAMESGPGSAPLMEAAVDYLDKAARLAPNEVSALIGRVIVAAGPAEDEVIDELVHRLTRRPLVPNQVGILQSLVVCQRKQACKTPPVQIRRIFAAALSHPRLRSGVKADLLTMLGMYYAEQLGDTEAALRLMREASDMQPDDVARRLNLAQILLFIPDYDAAESEVKRASELDRLGVFQWRSEKIKADIERFRHVASRQAPVTTARH